MLISVITPSLNQAAFINQTIQAVIDQNFSDFEHIIIDGGSTDGTLEILKSFSHLKLISEKDCGRADALNKGLKMACGEIIAWINSDDYYLPEAFSKVSRFFDQNKDAKVLVGRAHVVDSEGRFLFSQASYPANQLHFEGLLRFWRNKSLPQPSLFFKKEVLKEVGYFDSALHDYPDYDLVLRLSRKYKFYPTSDFFSCIRIQENAGSVLDIKNGVLEKKLLNVSLPHWKFLSKREHFKIVWSYRLAAVFIWWRASYESFAFKNKAQLIQSWKELSAANFFKKHGRLFLKHPAQSIWAAFHFGIKSIRSAFKKFL